MYNLVQCLLKQSKYSVPSNEQIQKVKKVQQYLQKYKIHQLFNQMMAKLIQKKPDKISQGLILILQEINTQKTFFHKQDFQHMFNACDFFQDIGQNFVNYQCLLQSLTQIGVQYSREQFLQKYPQFKLDHAVKKIDFINIMQAQYKQRIKI